MADKSIPLRVVKADAPQTNADRIRSMTDEELTAFLCDVRAGTGGECAGCLAWNYCSNGHTGWGDWLQQPAEVANGQSNDQE